jgi:DNA polymerase-3 subunit delta'
MDQLMLSTHPWLQPQWAALVSALHRGRFPHALLVTGQPGTGKAVFTASLTALLLCEEAAGRDSPCGRCPGCRLLAAGNHPDLFRIASGEDATAIKVDQIRALAEALSFSHHGHAWKVAILDPADAMNSNAANSLLKTLEEPTDNTVLLLVSHQPARLPATIRSRCQEVHIDVPVREMALQWLSERNAGTRSDIYLSLAGGAPLLALELAQGNVLEERRERFRQFAGIVSGREDPLAVAQRWAGDEDLQGLRWSREWLMDLLRIRMTGHTGDIRSIDLQDGLRSLASQLDSRVLFARLDTIDWLLQHANSSLNRQLLTEDALLAWAEQQIQGRSGTTARGSE